MSTVELHRYKQVSEEPIIFRCPECGHEIRISDRMSSVMSPMKRGAKLNTTVYKPEEKDKESLGGEWG